MTGRPNTSVNQIDALLEEAADLHTLPVVVLEANRMMSDPQTSAQDIANLLARDPSLAGRVLKLANSPHYGFRRRIGNLTQAIVILGFQAVRNLMLTASVIESFGNRESDFDFAAAWSRSVATAMIAQEIALTINSRHADESYVAGLLHDIGRLTVAQHLPTLSAKVHSMVEAGSTEAAAEREVLSVQYGDVGSRLVAAWGLPESICDAIRDHRSPQGERDEPNTTDLLHLASVLGSLLIESDRPPVPPIDGLSSRFGYDDVKLATWLDQVVVVLDSASEFFEILGLGTIQVRGA